MLKSCENCKQLYSSQKKRNKDIFNELFVFSEVSGLAKLEGEIADIDEGEDETQPTKYQLTGVVVHSGQASGGHYYSYILHKYDTST